MAVPEPGVFMSAMILSGIVAPSHQLLSKGIWVAGVRVRRRQSPVLVVEGRAPAATASRHTFREP